MTYFSKQLVGLMDEHGTYNKRELAEKLGVPKSMISDWMAGKSLPDCIQIQAVSNFFNVSADALCDTKFDD